MNSKLSSPATNWGYPSQFTTGESMLRLILIIVLFLLLLGSLPTWGYSSGWGYYPSGGLGLLVIIVVVLALVGRRGGGTLP